MIDIINQLTSELDNHVTRLMDIEDSLIGLQVQKEYEEKEIRKIKVALDALNGRSFGESEQIQPEVQVPYVPERPEDGRPVQVLPSVRDTGPRCSACGSEMVRDIRTLGNGKQVPLLVCRDSGCNNEQITN